MRSRRNHKKGFTLVELVVVIAILGILAAIAVPKISGFRRQAAKSADIATAASIAKAAELYYLDNEYVYYKGPVEGAMEGKKVYNIKGSNGNVQDLHPLQKSGLVDESIQPQISKKLNFRLEYYENEKKDIKEFKVFYVTAIKGSSQSTWEIYPKYLYEGAEDD